MAEAVVSMALETLRDLLVEESRFLRGVSGEVKALQTQLKEIQCLLKDADRRQHESQSVVNWIAEIRDLAYRAEDAIETHAFHVFSKRRGRGFRRLLRRFSGVCKESYSLHQIGSEISEIKSEIERVRKSMQEYGIRSIIQGESSTTIDENQKWKRQTFPHEIEDCFVGRNEELKQLVSLIVDDHHKEHRVVSIWGMGGIGKTTIARKVYNHIETKRSFECCAWVCITQQCQIRSVLEDVLKQLIPQKKWDDISSLSNTELIERLCEIQKAKRCMVVVDDVWEIDHWDDGLKHAFVVQGSKSKILVTTRKQKVADKVGSAFELGLLSVDDGLELLKKKAFPHSNMPDFAFEEKWLQEIGKEMVRKCDRLPLVISLLGGILSRKKSMREWELVDENISEYLYRRDDIEKENEIHGVLSLSYEDLPYYLKPCFLYMAILGEDGSIDDNILYRLWIAQGMISHENQGEETLMDTAELYLSELASRCIVQVELEDGLPGTKCRLCKLHGVVRELCLSKGKKDLGLRVLSYKGGQFSTFLNEQLSDIKARHLAIHFERVIMEVERDEFAIIHEDTSKQVRSLLFINEINGEQTEFPHAIFDFLTFKLLRVLVFKGCKFAGRKLPRRIGNLIHLRCLYFIYCELDELPSSISNLIHLNILHFVETDNVHVPNVFKKMCKLKHLRLPLYDEVSNQGNYKLRLDGLDALETLIGFDTSLHEIKSIIRLKNLQIFSAIVGDDESLSEIINAIATNWKNLEFCGITIEPDFQFTSVDHGLMNLKKVFTCPNLQYLAIGVQIGKLLEECRNQIITSKLVSLSLDGCEIDDDPMELLGKLPFLEELCLVDRSYVGEEMKCHAFGFPRLKRLQLDGLPNLREWSVDQGAMPFLSKIKICDCPHLNMIPDGLRFIPTLQKLKIIGMSELGKRVSDEGGEDFDKVRHVPLVIVRE